MGKKAFTTGSGNIFLDLGFTEKEAAELTLKSCLFGILQNAVNRALESTTQASLAHRLGVDQPIISKIINDRMSGFSVERIASYVLRLNYDICLSARPTSAKGRVLLASKSKLSAV